MTNGKKTETVQKLYAAFQRGDLPALLEHMTDDIDWGIETKSQNAVPWYGLGTGKPFAAAFFQALAKECQFTRFEPNGFLESDDSVACLVSYEATLKKNGRKVMQNVVHHFTFRDAQVSRWRAWEDTAHTQGAWNS